MANFVAATDVDGMHGANVAMDDGWWVVGCGGCGPGHVTLRGGRRAAGWSAVIVQDYVTLRLPLTLTVSFRPPRTGLCPRAT